MSTTTTTTAPQQQSENRRHSHTGLQTRIDDDGNTVVREFVVRGPSRYDIYNAEKPFGESYRRSVQRSLSTDDILPPNKLDVDALKENIMGTYVSTLDERRKSKEKNVVDKNGVVILGGGGGEEGKPQNYDENCNKEDNKIIINITNDLDKSVSTTKVRPEVEDDNKNIVTIIDTETLEKYNRAGNDDKVGEQSEAREALMKEIREGKKLNNTEIKDETRVEVEKILSNGDQSCNKPSADVPSNTFVEEEYSYEPDKQDTTSKVIVRQACVNDESQENFKNTLNAALSGGNPLKITTGPDGTFRFGSRRASAETNLADDDEEEDAEDIKPEENPARNSYVSNLKQAFDANAERARMEAEGKTEAFDGLRHYLHEHRFGLRELLVNNNVVIIEPIRNEYNKKSDDPADYNHKQLEGFDVPCRITGATVKSQSIGGGMEKVASNTLPRAKSQQQAAHHNSRLAFYHPIKVNRELIDAELPDPDKVKSAREVFEKAFKSNGPNKVITPPSPSTKLYHTSPRGRVTPEVRVVQGGRQKFERRRHGRFIVDPVLRDDAKQRLHTNKRWCDNGSLSSGVSSDLSLENDLSSNGSHRDTLDTLSSEEDDYHYGYDRDRHPVSREVLEKIRACGTTVTYYGGKIISHSDGPIRSPMTMTIMDEIRQTQARRTHSFSESQEPYLGVKFRLVKSNSCGSRLELAGAEDNDTTKLRSAVGHHESVIDKTISEEPANDEDVSTTNKAKEGHSSKTTVQKDEDTSQSDSSATKPDVIKTEATVHTWSEVELKEARKQWHCAPEAVRSREPDMEFENFEVLEDGLPPVDGSPLKSEMNPPPGRG